MKYEFHSGRDLCALCSEYGMSLGEVMLRNEMEHSELEREAVIAEMQKNLDVMRASIESGLDENNPPKGVFSGGDAIKLIKNAKNSNIGEDMSRLVAASMAVAEVNAAMGKIVAAPTAGASGILPAILLVCGADRGFDDEQLCMGLFAAGAVGCLVAEHASIAGASGGCQAETGTAAAMAAAALTELCGGSPEISLHAAAIALKNCLGLVCDPVGGLVECPCVKRNAIGVMNAVLSCDLALAGITSLIPFDEVVEAMQSVSSLMHSDLRETAKGGIAASQTAVELSKNIKR